MPDAGSVRAASRRHLEAGNHQQAKHNSSWHYIPSLFVAGKPAEEELRGCFGTALPATRSFLIAVASCHSATTWSQGAYALTAAARLRKSSRSEPDPVLLGTNTRNAVLPGGGAGSICPVDFSQFETPSETAMVSVGTVSRATRKKITQGSTVASRRPRYQLAPRRA